MTATKVKEPKIAKSKDLENVKMPELSSSYYRKIVRSKKQTAKAFMIIPNASLGGQTPNRALLGLEKIEIIPVRKIVVFRINNNILENLIDYYNNLEKLNHPLQDLDKPIKKWEPVSILNLAVGEAMFIGPTRHYLKILKKDELGDIVAIQCLNPKRLKKSIEVIRFRGEKRSMKVLDVTKVNDQESRIIVTEGNKITLGQTEERKFFGKGINVLLSILKDHPDYDKLPSFIKGWKTVVVRDITQSGYTHGFKFSIADTRVEKDCFQGKDGKLIDYKILVINIIPIATQIRIEQKLQEGQVPYAGTTYSGPTRNTEYGKEMGKVNRIKFVDEYVEEFKAKFIAEHGLAAWGSNYKKLLFEAKGQAFDIYAANKKAAYATIEAVNSEERAVEAKEHATKLETFSKEVTMTDLAKTKAKKLGEEAKSKTEAKKKIVAELNTLKT